MEKARSLTTGQQGVALSDGTCNYLLAVLAADLGMMISLPMFPPTVPAFFGAPDVADLEIVGPPFLETFEQVVALCPDADVYFACLAALHKSRLKYRRILQTQSMPTIDQVGPRGLLQYGTLPPNALVPLLFWRKWLYDIDNRAAQETGYLFEPIIAASIGGTPVSSSRSPVIRERDPSKRRQVDCIRGDRAYEFKIRVTIAASGQGRWQEEMEFPRDCQASGYVPVLIVLDPTDNARLAELRDEFLGSGGEVYLGSEAWDHLDSLAGSTMATFLEKYVRAPLQELMEEVPAVLPQMRVGMDAGCIQIEIGGAILTIDRSMLAELASTDEPLPSDVDAAL